MFCCGQQDYCYYLRHALRVDLRALRDFATYPHQPSEFAVLPVQNMHHVRDAIAFLHSGVPHVAGALFHNPSLRVCGLALAYASHARTLAPESSLQELACRGPFHVGFYRHAVLVVVNVDLFAAFALGALVRTGAGSLVRSLDADTLRMIFDAFCRALS